MDGGILTGLNFGALPVLPVPVDWQPEPPPDPDPQEPGVNVIANSRMLGDDSTSMHGAELVIAGGATGGVLFEGESPEAEDGPHRRCTITADGGGYVQINFSNLGLAAGKYLAVSFHVHSHGGLENGNRVAVQIVPWQVVDNNAGRVYVRDLQPDTRHTWITPINATQAAQLRIGPGTSEDGNQAATTFTFSRLMVQIVDSPEQIGAYSPTDPDAPGPAEFFPYMHIGGGIGCSSQGWGLNHPKLNVANRTYAQGMKVAFDGMLGAVGVDISSNNSSSEGAVNSKSGGTGNITFRVVVCFGRSKISGDGSRQFSARPDFGRIIWDGTLTHNRGNGNGGGGAQRRWWHNISFEPVPVTAGDYVLAVFYPVASNPAANFIAPCNTPTMFASSWNYVVPDNVSMSPNVRWGPAWGDECGLVLAETTAATADADRRYNRRDQVAQMALYYEDGRAWAVGMRESNSELRANFQITAQRRTRQRWRQLTREFNCRYVWLWCWWRTNEATPSLSLMLKLSDDTLGQSWEVGRPHGTSGNFLETVNGWDGGNATSTNGPRWTRFDLGGPRQIRLGHDYTVELHGPSSGRFYTDGARHASIAFDGHDGLPPPTINAWRGRWGQNSADALAHCEISTNGGASWQPPTMYGGPKDYVALRCFLEPVT